MTRLGFGLGFGKQTAIGLGGGAEIFDANTAYFNGSSSYAEAPVTVDSSLQIGSQEFSHNVWMKTTQAVTAYPIVYKRSGSTQFWEVATTSTIIQLRVESEIVNFDKGSLADGNLHLLTCVRDNDSGISQGGFTGELRAYIDGVELTVDSIVARTKNLDQALANGPTEPITYGQRRNFGPLPYEGDMFMASIHVGTVLTEQQILDEYNTGLTQCFDISPNEATITEGWKLASFDGSPENQALLGYRGVQDLTLSQNIAYTGSAQIECEP